MRAPRNFEVMRFEIEVIFGCAKEQHLFLWGVPQAAAAGEVQAPGKHPKDTTEPRRITLEEKYSAYIYDAFIFFLRRL